MIKNLLKGKNAEAQIQLDTLFNSFGDNPNILWYPSAGNDYRDILELSPELAHEHGITELPDLIIHTDYCLDALHLIGTVFNDNRTNVRINNQYELQLNQNIRYRINPHFVTFPEKAPNEPKIYLLDVSITSDRLGEFSKQVIYFLFENINFLDEIILRYNISISHLVKVREGCSFGGNSKSISVSYAFLSILKTKYLLIDTKEDTDFNLVRYLKNKYHLSLLDFDLIHLSSIISWSGLNVNVFTIAYRQQALEDEIFSQLLNTIANTTLILPTV